MKHSQTKFLFPFLGIVLLLSQSCSKQGSYICNYDRDVEVTFNANFKEEDNSKTYYESSFGKASWNRKDILGIVAYYDGTSYTDKYMRPFYASTDLLKGERLNSATFQGKLTNKGAHEYTYYGLYPYSAWTDASVITSVSSRLPVRQYPELHSWDGKCDIMTSKPISASSLTVASLNLELQFARLFGILKFKWGSSFLDKYGDEIVEKITITGAEKDIMTGAFSVNLSSPTVPSADMTDGENSVILDYRGKAARLSDLDAYFVICPGTYENITITIHTSTKELILSRSKLSISRGHITSATINWKTGDSEKVNQPILPKDPEALRILTFGHSYTDDSMKYICELLNQEGLTKVTFANLYNANASIAYYKGMIESDDNVPGGNAIINYRKYKYDGSLVKSCYLAGKKITVIDALGDESWDVIVFQTSLQDEGFYSRFGADLSEVIKYVKDNCNTIHSKTPIIAWHMFWPMKSTHGWMSEYNYDSDLCFSSFCEAAQEVQRNHEIELVIPTGTAIQSLRHSRWMDSNELTRDGLHLDIGIGCYAASCTWFEFFMKPCFGLSVVGNEFMPSGYTYVPVTDENKSAIQKAAALAIQRPYELSQIDLVNEMDASGICEKFDFCDDINW